MPELEIAGVENNDSMINRGRNEAILIEKTDDINELINILNEGPDQLNRVRLKMKLLERRKARYPPDYERFAKQQCSAFAEIAIEIIHLRGRITLMK